MEVEFQQNPFEFEWFVDILKREKVRKFLEIGSHSGGSFLNVARSLTPACLLVSVDLCEHRPGHLVWALEQAEKLRHHTRLIKGDSTDPEVVKQVRTLGPFDACFIDANHTLEYLWQDWRNYGSISRIVAFHDIGWKDKKDGPRIEVPQFWNAIKGGYRYDEINLNERKNGIGVLWR